MLTSRTARNRAASTTLTLVCAMALAVSGCGQDDDGSARDGGAGAGNEAPAAGDNDDGEGEGEGGDGAGGGNADGGSNGGGQGGDEVGDGDWDDEGEGGPGAEGEGRGDDGGGDDGAGDPGDEGEPNTEGEEEPDADPEEQENPGDVDPGEEEEEEEFIDRTIAPPGAQDFALFKGFLDRRELPPARSLDATGFINEHSIDLPPADCGDLICLHGMLGVMANMLNGRDCTMLMLGLNARLRPAQLARKPLNLVVSIDVSGSMRDEGKWEFAQRGLLLLLDALHEDDILTLVTYSSSARVIAEGVTAADAPDLAETINLLSPGGGTNLHDGLDLAFDMARRWSSGDTENRVVLLSDGEPTVGITNTPDIFAMAREYVNEGIGLTTIGLGESFDPALMRGLAELGGGNHYFLENVQSVEEVFVEEIEYFVTPIASNLRIELEAGEAYGLREVFGTSMQSVEGDTAVIEFPNVTVAHRRSHDDQEMGRRGGGGALMVELTPHRGWRDLDNIDIAEVTTMRLFYTPAGEPLGVENEQVVEYPFDPGALQEGGFFSVDRDDMGTSSVEKGFVMLNIFVGFRMAAQNAERGDLDLALVVLDDLDTALTEWMGVNNDLDITDDHRILLQFKDVLRDNGAMRPEDRPPVEEPWPRD